MSVPVIVLAAALTGAPVYFSDSGGAHASFDSDGAVGIMGAIMGAGNVHSTGCAAAAGGGGIDMAVTVVPVVLVAMMIIVPGISDDTSGSSTGYINSVTGSTGSTDSSVLVVVPVALVL